MRVNPGSRARRVAQMPDFLDDPTHPRRMVLMEPTVILRETT